MEHTTPEQNKIDYSIFNENQVNLENIDDYETVCINLNTNYIHKTAVIGKNVILGNNNIIGAYCVIEGDTAIGSNNVFKSFSSIGSEPEHKKFFGKPNKGLIIGDNNMFREFTTVNAGCERPTELKNNIIMLRGSHIGHDSIVNDDVIISCNVLVGGHSFIGEGANMGLGSICHQFSRIGSYAMIGMGCIITKKTTIECFGVYVGNPAKYIKENDYQKQNKTEDEILAIKNDFEII